jgi:hypothetical protein
MAASVGRPPGISQPPRNVNHRQLGSATINIPGKTLISLIHIENGRIQQRP